MTTARAFEPTKCMACGVMLDDAAEYCADCITSGQSVYDVADRAGDVAAARSMDPDRVCEGCGEVAPAADVTFNGVVVLCRGCVRGSE